MQHPFWEARLICLPPEKSGRLICLSPSYREGPINAQAVVLRCLSKGLSWIEIFPCTFIYLQLWLGSLTGPFINVLINALATRTTQALVVKFERVLSRVHAWRGQHMNLILLLSRPPSEAIVKHPSAIQCVARVPKVPICCWGWLILYILRSKIISPWQPLLIFMDDQLRSLTFIKSKGCIVYCEDHITICKKYCSKLLYGYWWYFDVFT